MKILVFILFITNGLIGSGQSHKYLQYIFSKDVEIAIERGAKVFSRKSTLYLELNKADTHYILKVRDFSPYSKDKKNKIIASNRYAKIGNNRYPIWFDLDDEFGVINETQDILGNAYTITFNLTGKIINEYKEQ